MEDSAHAVNEIRPAAGPERGRALPRDNAREKMMSRQAALTLRERIALFESLSRDAAWARAAVRIR
jgi:hypothetical protein